MLRSVSILCLLALPTLASAQSDSSARPRSPLCWRGKPEPRCGSFWITEMSGEYAFATTQTHYTLSSGPYVDSFRVPDVSSQLLWTVGPMFNTGPTRALGGTISAGLVSEGARIAVEARRRYWMSPTSAVDVSGGALRMDVPMVPNNIDHSPYGVTAGVYVVGGDLIHLNGHVDALLTGGRVRAAGTVGGGLGSYPALGATLLFGVLTLAVIAAFASNGDF